MNNVRWVLSLLAFGSLTTTDEESWTGLDIHFGRYWVFRLDSSMVPALSLRVILASRSESHLAGAVLEIVNNLNRYLALRLFHILLIHHYFYHSTNEPTSHILFDYTTTRSTKQQRQYQTCLVIKTSTIAHASVNDSANVRTTWRLHPVQSSIPAGRPRSSSLRVTV
jgi:hypothetical protein